MDSRDSLDQTSDSIDLTKSPVKHTHTKRHIEKINEEQVMIIQMKQLLLMRKK